MNTIFEYSSDGATVHFKKDKKKPLLRLFGKTKETGFQHLPLEDRTMAMAIAELKTLADELALSIEVEADYVFIPHPIVAALSTHSAHALGLPDWTELTLRLDTRSIVGSSDFKLLYEWYGCGRRQHIKRIGSFVETLHGVRRVPLWMYQALEIADAQQNSQDREKDWEYLARFRKALQDVLGDEAQAQSEADVSGFLEGIEIRVADSFSIGQTRHDDETDFEIIPFSRDAVASVGDFAEQFSESDSELVGDRLDIFQRRVRQQGALPCYQVGRNNYIVVEQDARPVLKLLSEKLVSSPQERREFILNPRKEIHAVVEDTLRKKGMLAGLSDEYVEELIELHADPLFIETKEYSERVIGIRVYQQSDIPRTESSSQIDWIPETIPDELGEVLKNTPKNKLKGLLKDVMEALETGKNTVNWEGHDVPVSGELVDRIGEKLNEGDGSKPTTSTGEVSGSLVLQTRENFEALNWAPSIVERTGIEQQEIPDGIRTSLKSHQIKGFALQAESWMRGMPGILNADEQGLGKTLQTIAFLRWIKDLAEVKSDGNNARPVLVVAPTSLLQNWANEVQLHCDEKGLGHLIPLYGNNLKRYKARDAERTELKSGGEHLDLSSLHDAIKNGKGARFWLLTTYTTLANYQFSFAKIPLSVVVFDEIQALKNPYSLRSIAARALNANYRIGLTGTPIENRAEDLWAIIDQVAPGHMGSLKDFSKKFAEINVQSMANLHGQVFKQNQGRPQLGFRRMKEMVAKELPPKKYYLYPRVMPVVQMQAYEQATAMATKGDKGAVLKALQHIRGVSLHPGFKGGLTGSDFIESSARLAAGFEILKSIQESNEAALVFIEHLKVQYQFIEIAKKVFNLENIDCINGQTPIQKRQEIVDRFQLGLQRNVGFNILVLSPKAAGTGLTLTAATHVIHLSRWWNPAVEEQCNDRTHRIGQSASVAVHIPVAIHNTYRENSFDCLLHVLLSDKKSLAESALWPTSSTLDELNEILISLNDSQQAKATQTVEQTMLELAKKTNTSFEYEKRLDRYRLN